MAYYSVVFGAKQELSLDKTSPDGSTVRSAFAGHIRANYNVKAVSLLECIFPKKSLAEVQSALDRQKVIDRNSGYKNIQTDWAYRE